MRAVISHPRWGYTTLSRSDKTGPIEPQGDVFLRSRERQRAKIRARREEHGGVGRTDGPRRRKGQPSYTVGKRIRVKFARRVERIEVRKTHDVLFGIDYKTGRPVLKLQARPTKEAA